MVYLYNNFSILSVQLFVYPFVGFYVRTLVVYSGLSISFTKGAVGVQISELLQFGRIFHKLEGMHSTLGRF